MPPPPIRIPIPFGTALLLLCLVATGCGEGDEETGRIGGRYVGQEIWIGYGPGRKGEKVRRTNQSREEARALVEDLRTRVLRGEDIGVLARRHSNLMGGVADGFSGLLPHDANAPDARDRTIVSVAIGEVTPIIELYEGFWFAKRVSLERGEELQRAFVRAARLRTRFRVLALLYAGAWIPDAEAREEVVRTRAETVALADSLLRRAKAGEPFDELARIYSQDAPSADRGGLAAVQQPDGSWTQWIRRQDPAFPGSVLEAAFTTPPGEIHPKVIVGPRGVFLVKVEEQREMDQ